VKHPQTVQILKVSGWTIQQSRVDHKLSATNYMNLLVNDGSVTF